MPQVGEGTTFFVGADTTGTVDPGMDTFTQVLRMVEITPPNLESADIDATPIESEETQTLTGVLNRTPISVVFQTLLTDPGQVIMRADAVLLTSAKATRNFRITTKNGEEWNVKGQVRSYAPTVAKGAVNQETYTIATALLENVGNGINYA